MARQNAITVKRVPGFWFKIKTRKLERDLQEEVKDFIRFNKKLIKGYGFGRVRGKRSYCIYMKDDSVVKWDVSRRYYI